LRALGRSSEIDHRLKEAGGICESYRGRSTAAYSTCRELVSRGEAAVALAHGRPLEAVALHRVWLKFAESERSLGEVKEDIFSAYTLVLRYRLLRDALQVAGLTAEAGRTEEKRRITVDYWKQKLSGRNDAEIYLQ
jgi:hypothetical protein